MPNVLIVDYGTGVAQTLGWAFKTPDIKLRWANDNDAALRALIKDPPDLVVVDLTSGSSSGFNLAAMLKMQTRHRPPVVVGLTAMGGLPLSRLEPGLRPLGIDRFVSLTWPLERRVASLRETLGRRAS